MAKNVLLRRELPVDTKSSSFTPNGKASGASSPRVRQPAANVRIIGAKGRPEPKTDWARMAAMSDAEITRRAKADPDAQPIPARAFKHFVLTPPHVKKKSITIRVDEDVLSWYKSNGEGYQKRMNHALRKWMQDEPQRQADWGAKPKKKRKTR